MFGDWKKRGQLTIFIIAGVIIILAIILFFFIFGQDIVTKVPPSKSPRVFIEKCIEDSVRPSINSVLEYGGLIEPRMFIERNDHKYNYLCFTDLYYERCYNYYPALNHIAEGEIKRDSEARVEECFSLLAADYVSRGWDVEQGDLNYSVEIVPGSVRLRINKPMSVTKGDSVDTFHDFHMKVPSDLYDLIVIARNVVNQEAQYCYFESNGFMVMYPKYNMTRTDYLESKIYHVQNRQTKEILKFAIRSCPYAPGFAGFELAG